jgi:hypothetical protein
LRHKESSRGIEGADCDGSLGAGTPLVALDRREAVDISERLRAEQFEPRATRAHEIDLRGRNALGKRDDLRVLVRCSNRARQVHNTARDGRVAACRHIQSMAARVLRGTLFAGRGGWTGALPGVLRGAELAR